MKVAILARHLYPYHGFGGLERHIYFLTKHLTNKGVQVILLLSPPKRDYTPSEEPSGEKLFISSFRLPLLGKLRRTIILDRISNYYLFTKKLGRVMEELAKKNRIDIVYAHGLAGYGYALALKRNNTLPPLILNPHGMEEFLTTNQAKQFLYTPFRYWVRKTAEKAARVIATDSCMIDTVVRELEVPKSKVTVVENAVDLKYSRRYVKEGRIKELASRYPLKGREVVMISVGRLEKNKGFDLMVRALSTIADELKVNWVWLLVGDGSERKNLYQMVAEAGLRDKIVMTGRVSDEILQNLFASSHLFIQPSLYEGSSIATLEAMAHGLALIGSAVGGIPDKIVPGENGYLLRPGNVSDIVEKLRLIIPYKDKMRRMGKRSLDLVEKFSWDRIVKKHIALYREVAGVN
jgi:glycogen(starch) synthase